MDVQDKERMGLKGGGGGLLNDFNTFQQSWNCALNLGLTSMDVHSSGKMGLRGVLYYFVTTFLAIILGIILVVSIHPGDKSNMPEEDEDAEKLGDDRVSSLDAFLDLIRYTT